MPESKKSDDSTKTFVFELMTEYTQVYKNSDKELLYGI